ncbi:hypothetical protein GSI_08079 [Ganoderma sinense ZZ0214-1]|uniref:ARID domain-containing protein n=1 Tax=Ganoderma sinense ZZ0214-1 TaxID=1077348 RepID=A0A2G8S7V9_9APHY|nr:hypothetical protein GSI_08079 [Ganoderma sinense ZZ0214-1]
MLPNNFVVGGQSGLPQSQPQPGPQQGIPNMGIDQRIWIQQQQQLAQIRAQQQANGGQIPQQMLELIRSRNPQVMAQQRQFASGMPQMGVNNSPFPHDPSQALQNAQPQFGNPPGGQNFGIPQHLQGMQRNSNQMFTNQGSQMRQLDLMLAQNQQNQNGLPNQNPMAAVLQRQFAQQQSQAQQPQPSQLSSMGAPPLPPGIFGNMAMQPNLQNMQQHNSMSQNRAAGGMVSQMPDGQVQGQQPGRRHVTLAEMQVKANEFKNAIVAGESRIRNLREQALTSHLPPESVAQEISKVQKEVMERRQALQKIMQYLRPTGANGAAAGTFPNGMDPMKMLATSPVPPQRLPGAPQNAQMGWMQNPSQPQFNSPRPMSSPAAHLVPNPTPQPQPPQMSTPQLPQMVASQQNQPQRAVPTPMPILNGGPPPTGGAQPTQRPNPISNLVPVTFQYGPLNRDTFTKAYFQQWLPKHPIDQSILSLDGRNIDLWALHAEVMTMSGYKCFVQQPGPNQPGQILCTLTIVPDQWPIIAGRLGFVNFPGDAREPAKSGPVVAVHLERVYKQCLHEFDSQYLRQLIHHRKMLGLGQQKPNGMENGGLITAPQGLSDLKDPKVISEIMSYANLSVQEMHARGVQPQIISLVERNREQLKSTLETQRSFAQGIQNAAPQSQPRSVSNPAAMGNVNQMLHSQAGMNMTNAMNGVVKPPMQPGQPAQPMNMPSTSTTAPNGQPQQRPGGSALIPISATGRPTQAQTTAAIELVRRLKEENKHVGFPTTRPLHIPDGQRLEYNAQFERLHRLVTALDQKLPHFAVCMKEEVIKKLVVMIQAVQQQRDALTSNPSQYYMPLAWVIAMQTQVTQTEQVFHQWVNSAMRATQQPDANQSHTGANAAAQPGPSNQQIRPPAPPLARPPTAQTVHTPAALSPPGPPAHTPVASGASPQGVMTPSISKKQTPKPSGDVASASTPTHVSSPQTPKSPKNRAKPKAPPKPRKPSTKVSSVSSPNAGPSETKAPATPAAAATPVSAPTPEPSAGSKRPREEEPIASTSTSTPPSAKKIRTDWDDAPSDAPPKRDAEGVRTEEDPVKLLEQMSSWLEGDGQDHLRTEIAESLDEILRAYPVAADDGMSLSFMDSINVAGCSSPKPAAIDPAEFFDFTLYGLPEEDAGSKADTPDLVQASSSVGPSPGSASETEVHLPASASTGADTAKIADPKGEPPSGGDSMSQDLWRAIDGGESAFYNSSDNWKWDQTMQPLDQPWAIYSS